MPALRLFGRSWHLASDTLPILGICLIIPAFAFLVAFIVLLSLQRVPLNCPGTHAQLRHAVAWGMPAFQVLNIATSLMLIVIGLRGQ
jgi:hypothetical protein